MTFKKLRFKFPRRSLVAAGLARAVAPALGSAEGTAESGAATSGVIPTVVTSVGELATVPAPSLTAKAWLTLDANSGQIIAAQNPEEKVEPASLTKLMTAYVVFDALENKRLTLDQQVTTRSEEPTLEIQTLMRNQKADI